jgi:DNA-binding NtrC family response regulator
MENIVLRERFGLTDLPAKEGAATVFIVDDEPMVGEVVSVVLGMEGFKTRLFTCPADALEAFETAAVKPHLLITDLVMKPFDGLDLMVRCRQLHPNLRTILYSGNCDIEAIQRHETKADAFLSKPFLPKELIQQVQALVSI